MKNINRVHWYFLFVMILQLILPLQLILESINITDIRIVLLLSHIVGFIIPGIIYIKLIRKKSLREILRFNKITIKQMFFIILLGFTCQPIMMFMSAISQFFFDNTVGEAINSIMSTPYIILLLLIAVLPSISEEITIRGIILEGYDQKNIYVASIMTGLLFGIMHLNPQQFLYTAVLGFILALIVRITNSIYSAMIIHFIVNGTSITIQKMYQYIESHLGNGAMLEEAAEISLKSLPLLEKIIISGFYGIIAILFSAITFLIINKLYRDNIKNSIIGFRRNEIIEKERIINIPLIIIVVGYILLMNRIV